MAHEQLERTLKELERAGTFVSEEGGRQVWRFEHSGRSYLLHFYPRGRGNRAIREFRGLTQMQRAQIPSQHAVALLSGFRIKGELGDAVVLNAIEPSERLDRYLAGFDARGEEVPQRRDLARQVRNIAAQLGRAKLGHARLGLEHFLLSGQQLYLTGGEWFHWGGLRMSDVLYLGHSTAAFASSTEMLRAWQMLGPGVDLPRSNRVSKRLWRAAARASHGENEYFGKLRGEGWAGIFTKRADLPRVWAPASRLTITQQDWQRAWPALLEQIERDQLEVIKRGDSGDVLAGEVIVSGKPVAVIVKRPRRKFWRQALIDLTRASRARRTWIKTWKMIVRNVPCEWPMLVMEKRRLGYVTDAAIVFARVEGATLAGIDLDTLEPDRRELLFRRVGRVLRRIELLGFTHLDAKSTNWIVFDDGTPAGPRPVLVDVDGVRHYRWATAGILRLLRAMKQHPQYTPADSLALCQGYAPRAVHPIEEEASVAAKSEIRSPKSETEENAI